MVFESSGLKREHWNTATSIRTIFREAFAMAGLPYFNPHSFRNTLTNLGEKICRTPEDFKAWSQNLGHEGVLTTFYSYGSVQTQRQADILKQLRSLHVPAQSNVNEFAKAVAREMRNQDL